MNCEIVLFAVLDIGEFKLTGDYDNYFQLHLKTTKGLTLEALYSILGVKKIFLGL